MILLRAGVSAVAVLASCGTLACGQRDRHFGSDGGAENGANGGSGGKNGANGDNGGNGGSVAQMTQPEGGEAGAEGSGVACEAGCSVANATTMCVQSECAIAKCATGFLDCNGEYADGCETADVAPPTSVVSLAGPEFGIFTGSVHSDAKFNALRPEFRWKEVEATACGAVRYELQADDSCGTAVAKCAFPSPELDVSGLVSATYRPPQPLPVSGDVPVGSRYVWRVRACDGANRCADWSSPAYVEVGRLQEDLNGDGYADLVTASGTGLLIYLGSSDFNLSSDGAFGGCGSPEYLGDVNGDGFSDVTCFRPEASGGGQIPQVVFGAANVAALTSVALVNGRSGPSSSPRLVRTGDRDGDGFADLAVVVNRFDYAEVHQFAGTTKSESATLPFTWKSPTTTINYPTCKARGVGDLDGDLRPEFMVACASEPPMTWLLAQKPADPPMPHSVALTCLPVDMGPAGDFDGDGFGDSVIGCKDGVYLYSGGSPLPEAPSWNAVFGDVESALAADMNDDGKPDLVVGTSAGYPGAFEGGGPKPQKVTNAFPMFFSSAVLGAADHDGDGRKDLIGAKGTSVSWARARGDFAPPLFNVMDPAAKGVFAR